MISVNLRQIIDYRCKITYYFVLFDLKMEDQELKHTPAHLASVFADILNPETELKIDTSNRSKKKTKRNRPDSTPSASEPGDQEPKKPKSDPSTSASTTKSKTDRKKREWDNLNRVKPDPISGRELERSLVRVATKGVVQLFNAIKEHQSRVGQAVAESGTTSVKMEKKVKSIVKKDRFLDLVSKTSKDRREDGETKPDKKSKVIKVKEEEEEEEDEEPTKKKWDVLRDDFLLNSAKDWDKDGSD